MSWKNIELAKVCEVFADGDWIESKDQSDIGIRLIQTGNVGFGRFKARDSKARYINEETFKRLRCTEIKEGDLLVSRLPDPVGRACIIPQLVDKAITAVDCTIIRTKQEILYSNYLNYYCQSPQYFEQVKKNITGATRQRISRSLLGKTLIPLAPLATQQKIVAKLDAIFAEIDTATAAAEANANNAEALFQSYLTKVFERGSVGFMSSTIGDICTLRSGTTVSQSLEKTEGELPYLKVADMNLSFNQNLITTSSRFLDKKDISSNLIIRKGSTIFPKRGGAIDTNKKRITDIDVALDLNIMSVYPSEKLNQYLLYFFFLSLDMKKLGSGSSIRQINNYDIEPLIINFPKNHNEQIKLVNVISNLKFQSEKLLSNYKNKKSELFLMRQSILQRAFSGELVKD